MNEKILTIDGASGVGKGTIARIIAKNNNWKLLDSGSIYRSFAFSVKDINNPNKAYLISAAKNLNLVFIDDKILLNNIDISSAIRNEEIGNLASKFAKFNFVREALLQRQRVFATEKGLVADGRDMGTVVFPNAKYQIFLNASIEVRAKRRAKQLQVLENSSKMIQFFQNIIKSKNKVTKITASIITRDKRDKNRINSPLIPSKNALIIDTSKLSIKEVVEKITSYMSNLR